MNQFTEEIMALEARINFVNPVFGLFDVTGIVKGQMQANYDPSDFSAAGLAKVQQYEESIGRETESLRE